MTRRSPPTFRRTRPWGIPLLLVGALACAVPALANGRYPAAGLLAAHPSDANLLALRTTYGLIVTDDAGAHWRWICEEAVPFAGQLDPFVVFAGNGNLLLTSAVGLRTTRSGACTWNGWAQPLANTTFSGVDLARDPTQGTRVVALVHAPGLPDRAVVTLDGGESWQPLGNPLPAGHEALTLDVATGGRLYASTRTTTSKLEHWVLRSDDGAQTWSILPFAPMGTTVSEVSAIWLGGVAPGGPERLWIRAQAESGDELWQSDDGGVAWTSRFKTNNKLLGFAVSPDGQQLAVGVPGDTGGLWRGTTSGGVLQRVNAQPIRCLTWAPQGLYACSDEATSGFTLGVSQDGGATLAPLYRSEGLTPHQCANNATAMCLASWPFIQTLLAGQQTPTTEDTPPATPAPNSCSAAPTGGGGGCTSIVTALILLSMRVRSGRLGQRPRQGPTCA